MYERKSAPLLLFHPIIFIVLQTKDSIHILHPNRDGAAEILRVNEYNCTAFISTKSFFLLMKLGYLRFSARLRINQRDNRMVHPSSLIREQNMFDRRHVQSRFKNLRLHLSICDRGKWTSVECQVGRVFNFPQKSPRFYHPSFASRPRFTVSCPIDVGKHVPR